MSEHLTEGRYRLPNWSIGNELVVPPDGPWAYLHFPGMDRPTPILLSRCEIHTNWEQVEPPHMTTDLPVGGEAALQADLDTLREAAQLMRDRATAAFVPWHAWGDRDLPQRSTVREWAEDMNGYLGDAWGEHAASWHPVVALAVADWLSSEAATRGEMEPFAEVINATITQASGVESFIRFGRHEDGSLAFVTDTFDAALAVARAYLDPERMSR